MRLDPCIRTFSPSKRFGNTLTLELEFDPVEYQNLREDEYQEYLIAFVTRGVMMCRNERDVPIRAITRALASFRDGGYQCNWVALVREFDQAGLVVELHAHLEMYHFKLFVRVLKHGREVMNTLALRTEPAELMYSWRFSTVELAGNLLIIRNRVGGVTWTTDLDGIP